MASAGYDAPGHYKKFLVGATKIPKGIMCKLSGGLLVPCDTLGETGWVGVTTNDGEPGREVDVCIDGECQWQMDDATVGANQALTLLTVNADGRAVAHSSTYSKIGWSMEGGAAAVSGAGRLTRVLIRKIPA